MEAATDHADDRFHRREPRERCTGLSGSSSGNVPLARSRDVRINDTGARGAEGGRDADDWLAAKRRVLNNNQE